MPFHRDLEPVLRRAARSFPAIVLTGPRRAGKTYLLRNTFPRASYRLLEDPDLVARVRADPRGFLEDLEPPVILDEIQNAPELLPYVRTKIDARPRRMGQWFLTGSQDFALMRGVTESMAGRAAILHLLPLGLGELGKWDLLRGGYPEVWLRPKNAALWFRSYVQTYLERDVRSVTAVRDLATFRTFLALVAARSGQILNKTDIAAPLGVSVPTVTQWLSVLDTTGVILVVRPFFENFGKRLVKTPKIFFTDTGLLCHLLGIESARELARSTFAASVFETFVAAEIAKRQAHSGRARELYFFRDEQGLEVDFLVPHEDELVLIEAKSSKTLTPKDARPLEALRQSIKRKTRSVIVSPGAPAGPVAKDVRALSPDDLIRLFA